MATNNNELRERRQAELDFVSAAYSVEEAWWEVEATNNEEGEDEVATDVIVARVHRRLELTASETADMVPVVLILSMPRGYPSHDPLQIQATLLESSSSPSSSPSLVKTAYDSIPKLMESCREVACDFLGDEAVFSVLSRADQWLQEEWPNFYRTSALFIHSNNEKDAAVSTTSDAVTPIVLGRRMIYSHHIIAKTKRSAIQTLAAQLHLTGYMKIGWPGLILLEGLEKVCVDFYDEIRPWSWQYLVVRGEQQEQVASLDELEAKRCFPSFQEVDDMSIVAQHCRAHGLEALFKTSMKVYAEATPLSNSTESQQPLLSGALILVDHMNDAKSYRKWLRKTAAICECKLLIKQSLVSSEGERPVLIIVVLIGSLDNHAVSNMLKRWRTAKVDVDSRGKPCLEGQMTVLMQGEVNSKTLQVLDWNNANSEENLSVSNNQLQDVLTSIGGPAWREAFEAILSGVLI
jgi:hypothetical protein